MNFVGNWIPYTLISHLFCKQTSVFIFSIVNVMANHEWWAKFNGVTKLARSFLTESYVKKYLLLWWYGDICCLMIWFFPLKMQLGIFKNICEILLLLMWFLHLVDPKGFQWSRTYFWIDCALCGMRPIFLFGRNQYTGKSLNQFQGL